MGRQPGGPIDPWSEQITFLNVSDLDASEAFYRRLGLVRALDQGRCRILRAAGAAHVGLCERPEGVSTEGIIVTFAAVDLEERAAALQAGGIPFEVEPRYDAEYDITQAFLRDPDGYLVELQRFEDPRWPRPPGAAMPTLPEGCTAGRRTPTFTEATIPPGLQRAHTTRADTWARIEVEAGLLRYRIRDGAGGRFVLRPDRPGIVRPREPHDVSPIGAVRFAVQFWVEPGAGSAPE